MRRQVRQGCSLPSRTPDTIEARPPLPPVWNRWLRRGRVARAEEELGEEEAERGCPGLVGGHFGGQLHLVISVVKSRSDQHPTPLLRSRMVRRVVRCLPGILAPLRFATGAPPMAEEQIWDRAEPSEDDPGARRIFRNPRAYRWAYR